MSSRALGSPFSLLSVTTLALLLLSIAACSGEDTAALAAFDNGEYEKAMDLWLPLADAGDAEAQFGVGYLNDEGLGVPKDGVEAIRWYRLAADQGHPTSQFNLGTLYQTGREDVPADPGRAADWYRMAAEQGHAKAQYHLAKLYYRGKGLPRNYDLARDWFQKSADQGYVPSVNHLGMLYVRGLGVQQDLERGYELVLQAAESGEPAAQVNLAGMYIRAKGTDQDFIEALKWHTIFDTHAIRGAGLPMDWVDNNMTPKEIEEAKRRAADWLAAHPAAAEE